MSPSFRIYSSSAGSGKTYQLTKEYLLLALGADDPAYFKRILAITFTNDAAGEMKEACFFDEVNHGRLNIHGSSL